MSLLPSYSVASDAPLEFFAADGASAKGGGQGMVLAIEDAAGGRFALKAFSSRAAAEREWSALWFHKDDKVVPEPFFFGRLDRMPDRFDGMPWAIVMEWIEGTPLSELLEESMSEGTRFTWERTMEVMAPVVRFCAKNDEVMSRRPNAHRDIKPGNIIIESGTGRTRVVDFGIAARKRRRPTRWAGGPRGTEGFSAPELFVPDDVEVSGDPSDPKVDTYSIAAVMTAMLEGVPHAPRYGSGIDMGMPIDHDAPSMATIAQRLQESLSAIYGMDVDDQAAEAVVDSSVEIIDFRIRSCLSRCLSLDQEDRPDPSELPSVIPLDIESFANEVHLISSVTSLGGGERFKAMTLSIDDEIRSDRDVIEALDEFNSGHYERAAEIFEKRSRCDGGTRGSASCAYYLGVMIRDGYFSAARDRYSTSDVAFLFGQAAEAGNVLAQNALGQMLYEGFEGDDGATVVEDRSLGLEWVRRAAEDRPDEGKVGFRFAKEFLARHGQGVE